MIRFYAPDIASTWKLPESESGHAVRVLRHKPGDVLEVVDGLGNLYICRLVGDNPKGATVEPLETRRLEKVWAPSITLAVAPTKNIDRMEWLLEKLVEIGVDRFVPVRCARSERKGIKHERLEKIAVAAMKQSLKAILPRIDEFTPLGDFLREVPGASQRFVGWCDADTPRELLAKTLRPATDTTVLIGPEGDFTTDEIEMCRKAGFLPVTMGDNRLRTETAALVACDTFHILNQALQ